MEASQSQPAAEASASRPLNNAITAAVATAPMALALEAEADWEPAADANRTPFEMEVDRVLRLTAEVARNLIGAHQSAAALIVADDWHSARKWFSLSAKYADWYAYRAPAAGIGIHALVVTNNEPVRLTQAELVAHPAWKNFGAEVGKHPPMRGWLAIPLIGRDGRNYGLLQLSDKYNDADFTADDALHLTQLAQLTAAALDALGALHGDERLGQAPA